MESYNPFAHKDVEKISNLANSKIALWKIKTEDPERKKYAQDFLIRMGYGFGWRKCSDGVTRKGWYMYKFRG